VDVNGGDARPGDALEYTLKLQNDGDGTGKDVTAVLPLDGKLENLQLDAQGVLTPGMATWKLGTLAPGQGAALTIKATLKKPLVYLPLISRYTDPEQREYTNLKETLSPDQFKTAMVAAIVSCVITITIASISATIT
jgi:hypothetical protein